MVFTMLEHQLFVSVGKRDLSTIGTLLGAGEGGLAKRACKILLKLMGFMAGVMAVILLCTKNKIGYIFSNDDDIVHYSSQLAAILSVSYMLLSITFACYGTLQGQGRPHYAAISMFFGLWGLSVPCGWYFGIHLHWGLTGVWDGMVIGYSFMTLVMSYFVLTSDWEKLSAEAQKRSEKKEVGKEIVENI